jgi:hypothetical protein
VLSDAWAEEQDDDLDDEERWLYVEPIGSRPAYRDMIDFITTRSDPRLSARLAVAVDGRGAFSRFKRTLDDWPEDRLDWIEFSEERRRGRAGQSIAPRVPPTTSIQDWHHTNRAPPTGPMTRLSLDFPRARRRAGPNKRIAICPASLSPHMRRCSA